MEKPLLSPKSDFVFKLIFGDSRNVEILAAFLKAVLNMPETEFEYLTILDTHLKPEFENDKLCILDVKIHTKTGKIVNVEVQVSNFPQMRVRTVFYMAKMITEQVGKGSDYDEIKKVVSIVITDYKLIPENESYHNHYCLYDPKTNSQFTDVMEVHTLELPKLPSKNDKTPIWDWMQFLKSSKEEEIIMIAEKNPQIGKAYAVLKELSQDERARMIYEEREKARRDELARMNGARQEAALDIAKNALKMNMKAEDIANLTKLAIERIEQLKDEE